MNICPNPSLYLPVPNEGGYLLLLSLHLTSIHQVCYDSIFNHEKQLFLYLSDTTIYGVTL